MDKLLKFLRGERKFDDSGGEFTCDPGPVELDDDEEIEAWTHCDAREGGVYLPELQLTLNRDDVISLIPGECQCTCMTTERDNLLYYT
jgi:hypothetical protein